MPQFKESLTRSAQWVPPSGSTQLFWVGGQPQLPSTHASPAAQTLPHWPQFCVSEESWVQEPLQRVPPVAPQTAVGVPVTHCCEMQMSPVAQSALVTHGAGVAVNVKQPGSPRARRSVRRERGGCMTQKLQMIAAPASAATATMPSPSAQARSVFACDRICPRLVTVPPRTSGVVL